jgi:hypothetical protein
MKVFIATPMYGGNAKSAYMIGIQNLILELARLGHQSTVGTISNESLITRARNTLTHSFLETDFDVLLFIDADHGFVAEDIIKMLESDKDIIGAIPPMKAINWEEVRQAALAGKENLELYTGFYAINTLEESADIRLNEPFKVRAVGTGLVAIKRHVFEKLKPLCKTYKGNTINSNQMGVDIVEYFTTSIDEKYSVLLSEDYNFCDMWRKLGNDIWVAPWIRITHIGDYTFAGSMAASLLLKQEIANKVQNND